jgi:hypothetical protein
MTRSRKTLAKLIRRACGPPWRAAWRAARRCPARYQGRTFRDYFVSWRKRIADDEIRTRDQRREPAFLGPLAEPEFMRRCRR